MTLNRLTVCLIVLRLLLLERCILPVPQETRGKELRDEDLTFINFGVTTKNEIVERLGQGRFWEEHNVIAYYWITSMNIYVVMPDSSKLFYSGTFTYQQQYGLYIQFDSNDKMKRFQRVQVPDKGLSIEEWLERE